MRRRLLAMLAPTLLVLAVGIGVAYAALGAERQTQTTYGDRLGDAARFAALADHAIASADTTRLTAELGDYEQLYASPVWIVGLDGVYLRSPGSAVPGGLGDLVERAFAGDRPATMATVWPWSTGPMWVVEPVGRDSQVTAIVVIAAPTDHLRASTLRHWGVGAVLLVVPLAAILAGIWPVTRWVLRPVRDVERVAVAVRSGDAAARADVEHGPSELRELSLTFNSMVDTVQRSSQRQRAFVEDAAHQLRNPLASLRLSVENLGPWAQDPPAREAFDDAVAEVEQMGETFEAMLTSASLGGSGRTDPHDALSRILAVGARRWEQTVSAAGMRLQLCAVETDAVPRQPAGGLLPVLDELIANATRLSGGSTVRVETSVRPDQATVTVADDGVGLSEAETESATGRFWRSSRHQNVSGTGLGLAIVAEALADVGGSITLESNRPTGLRAVVRLPIGSQVGAVRA